MQLTKKQRRLFKVIIFIATIALILSSVGSSLIYVFQ